MPRVVVASGLLALTAGAASLPIAHFREAERRLDGSCAAVLHALLASAECPFTCVFCDLWRRTLDGPTPPGAILRQLAIALRETGPLPATCGIKLYNASNFFDPRAVPAGDDEAIAALLQPSTGSPSNATRGWSGGAAWSSRTASPGSSRLRWAWRPPMRRPWHNSTRG